MCWQHWCRYRMHTCAYRVDKIGTDHCACASFASLTVHHCHILRVLAQPICHPLTELFHQWKWWGLQATQDGCKQLSLRRVNYVRCHMTGSLTACGHFACVRNGRIDQPSLHHSASRLHGMCKKFGTALSLFSNTWWSSKGKQATPASNFEDLYCRSEQRLNSM